MSDTVLDACCLINLYTSGEFRSLLEVLGGVFYVPLAVRAESLYMEAVDELGETTREPIVLDELLKSPHFSECDVTGQTETALYVRLARDLGDGEAMALAIAKSRGWSLATDDRKARRLGAGLDVHLVCTPQLMRRLAETGKISRKRVRSALSRISDFACFRPRRDAPDYEWWMDLGATTEGD